MSAWPEPVNDVVIFLLIFWATTGLTVIHLGVLAWRRLTTKRPKTRDRASAAAGQGGGHPVDAGPALTFIVPVYNDEQTVGPTLESILRQSVPPARVIAVNDGSTDGTAAVLESFRTRGVDVIHMPRNGGKTRAIEEALRHVTTPLVAFTDADSVVDRNYIREIVQSFRDPKVVAVGGAVESIPHTWVTAARQVDYMITVNVDRNAETTMNALIVLPGVSSTYRTEVLREMGFEHDTIAEDFDLTFRLQKAGKKIAMNLKAKVYTSDPPTLRSYYTQLARWYTDFWLVVKKHRKLMGKRTFGIVEVPMTLLNTTVSSALYLVLPFYLLFFDTPKLLWFLVTGALVDLLLVIVAVSVYRRQDLWWALASRVPARFIGRWAFLSSMARVLVGKPGLRWRKLPRRGTAAFLAQR